MMGAGSRCSHRMRVRRLIPSLSCASAGVMRVSVSSMPTVYTVTQLDLIPNVTYSDTMTVSDAQFILDYPSSFTPEVIELAKATVAAGHVL